MKKINILVLGVGGNVSQGIITALRHSNIKCNIVGACVSPESLGLYFCDKAYISPYANDPSFIDWVSMVCSKENIDIVLTGVEENILALETRRNDLSSLGIHFIASPIEYLNIGNDKFLTCEWLKDNGLNYPKFARIEDKAELKNLIDTVGFPLIAKPCKGKGSNGIIVLNDVNDLNKCPQKEYVIQEILGNDDDDEYTIGCYIDKNKVVQDFIIMKRWLKHGTTFKASIVENKMIEDECRKICSKFKAIGPLNIQMRIHKGKPVCFELNVRFSGTTPLRAKWGYNDVEALINEYVLGLPVKLKPQKEGLAYRYYNEAYIDLSMIKALESSNCVENVIAYRNFKEN